MAWHPPRITLDGLDEMTAPYTFVDCQGFAGGFACGATLAGMRLVGKLENTGGFGVPLVEANRAFLGDAWEAQVGPANTWEPVHADVVVGTPPCTAFSNMSVGTSVRGIGSSIEHCMWDLIEYAGRVRPAAVMMESVGGAFTKGRSLMRALGEHLNELTGLVYRTTHVIQNNLATGGCTNRKRYFLVLSQMPFGVERHEMTWLPTTGDAIGDLTGLQLTWDAQPVGNSPTWWSRDLRSPDHTVDGHETVQWSHTARLKDLVLGDGVRPGVNWYEGEHEEDILKRYYARYGCLPESWNYETKGKRPPEGETRLTRAEHLIKRGLEPGGFNQIKRWRWDRPGSVISGAGPFMVWHPEGRHVTHREVARFLGFPDTWVVGSAAGHKQLHMYWGKGTSVHPARWVSEWLVRSLDGHRGSIEGEPLEDGSRLIDISNDWRPLAKRQWGTTNLGGIVRPGDDEPVDQAIDEPLADVIPLIA